MQLTSPRNPHVQEIVDEKNDKIPEDKPSYPRKGESLKAYSLEKSDHNPLKENYRYLDCEYMLKMYLPEYLLWWFSHEGSRIRTINPDKKDSRWVFIPSFRRAEIMPCWNGHQMTL